MKIRTKIASMYTYYLFVKPAKMVESFWNDLVSIKEAVIAAEGENAGELIQFWVDEVEGLYAHVQMGKDIYDWDPDWDKLQRITDADDSLIEYYKERQRMRKSLRHDPLGTIIKLAEHREQRMEA